MRPCARSRAYHANVSLENTYPCRPADLWRILRLVPYSCFVSISVPRKPFHQDWLTRQRATFETCCPLVASESTVGSQAHTPRLFARAIVPSSPKRRGPACGARPRAVFGRAPFKTQYLHAKRACQTCGARARAHVQSSNHRHAQTAPALQSVLQSFESVSLCAPTAGEAYSRASVVNVKRRIVVVSAMSAASRTAPCEWSPANTAMPTRPRTGATPAHRSGCLPRPLQSTLSRLCR